MHQTSELYKTLLETEGHGKETKVEINGVSYEMEMLSGVSTSCTVFSESNPAVGGCVSGEITVNMLLPSGTIPRRAEIRPYVRLVHGSQASEWIPKGVYYIDTRKVDDSGYTKWLTLKGYDAMLKAEAELKNIAPQWLETGSRTDILAVQDIAGEMGVEVDPRTIEAMDKGYSLPVPLGYTMRETLGHIAAAYGGNFIMSDEGKLLLIQLNGIPVQTNYLIVSNADQRPITFGGVRILV